MTNRPAWNIKDNEARIILTHRCNYKCIFCHNEGFDSAIESWQPKKEQLLKIIAEILNAGCTDITLTGGEPLIYKDLVVDAVKFIAAENPLASVTIISNASLLTPELVQQLAEFNNVRFNLSLHTADSKEYLAITAQQKFSLSQVQEKISWLKTAGIPFKLNCVAMRETMTKQSIKALTEFASETGALALKIIELLIMEAQTEMFPAYIANSSICKMLPSDFSLVQRNSRRDEYGSPQRNLIIELQKCRCRFGCKQCLTNNTSCFTANGEFFPCFEYSGKSYDLKTLPMRSALDKGMEVITTLAGKFGDDSPSLIKDAQFTARRRELYFYVDNQATIDKLSEDATLIQKREYSDFYFDSPLQHRAQTVQMRVHHGDKENAKLIISTSYLESEDTLAHTARIFQNKNKFAMINQPEFIINTLKHLGWQISHKIKSIEDEYKYNNIRFKILNIDHEFNLISLFSTDNNITLAEAIEVLPKLKPITENIDSYLKKYKQDPIIEN